jgi:hypothetical protein
VVSVDESKAEEKALEAPLRFYKKRNQFYTGLLIFVVVIGLPIVSVPHLRNRLSTRIMMLKTAAAGNVTPAVAQVGANQDPFPAEYEKPGPPVYEAFRLPPAAPIIPQTPGVYIPSSADAAKTPASGALDLEMSQPPTEGEGSMAQDEAMPDEAQEPGPEYQQGEIEREVYDLLLQSNPKIAEMVRGSNPSMIFDSWDAAYRGDDIYWVRVNFRLEDNSIREYIWEVKLDAKEVMPLSYYARAVS